MWVKVSRNRNYSINELGEIRNDATRQIKKPYANKRNGYLYVDLYESNKPKKVPVHRLIAEAFIPNPDDKPCVDHKDGNRQNNAIDNLRWATYSENNSRFGAGGTRSDQVKVTHYAELRNKRGGGHLEWLEPDSAMYFSKISDAADYFGCTQGNITPLLKSGEIGRRGKMRGYKFEYCKDV